MSEKEESEHPIIKLGGGYGLYREAIRLTLEELLSKGLGSWDKAAKVYEKNRMALEKVALRLGRQAVSQLRLENVHDEILKMIGALNWRTSYRQNQYYHSLEVAQLAGILAYELNEDCFAAKRCGLLHDIGKGIDYKIEGSHAIISGDYADRFGEAKNISETIMSHHNDIILETPLSYILKTADTLSGARPGARVHLEEGYQIRLSSIDQSIRSFPGILKVAIMSGGREVHIEVNHKKVKEHDLERLTKDIVKKLETEVAFPGQIKVVMTRRYEAIAVA
jgi:ribonuclease Y